MTVEPKIDLLDLREYESEGQPHHLFRRLRENDPVHRHA
jgi:hypothetical protein